MPLKNLRHSAPQRALAATILCLMLGTGIAASTAVVSASAADTDGVSGAPADENAADGRSRFSYQVSPGQHLQDFYVVRNTGTTTHMMKVFATDAFNTADGSFGLLNTAQKPKDAGTWVTFAGGVHELDIPLAAGESQVVPFTVTVPADASPGDHAAGLVISDVSPAGTILVDRRVATRVYVRVAGALQPTLTVGSIAASYSYKPNPFGGNTNVTFTVKNNGNVALGANTVIGVNTFFGIQAAPLMRHAVTELLPGATRIVTVTIPGVAQLGYLDAFVRLIPTVDADARNPGVLRRIDRDSSLFAMPWWLLAITVVVGGGWTARTLRRRNDTTRAAAWIAYTEAEAIRKANSANQPELVDAERTQP